MHKVDSQTLKRSSVLLPDDAHSPRQDIHVMIGWKMYGIVNTPNSILKRVDFLRAELITPKGKGLTSCSHMTLESIHRG